jgi:hypothetical protein
MSSVPGGSFESGGGVGNGVSADVVNRREGSTVYDRGIRDGVSGIRHDGPCRKYSPVF